jgi:hypothetical protein
VWASFEIVRGVLASHGIDIEPITDPEELEDLVEHHGELIHDLLTLKVRRNVRRSTEHALLAAMARRHRRCRTAWPSGCADAVRSGSRRPRGASGGSGRCWPLVRATPLREQATPMAFELRSGA